VLREIDEMIAKNRVAPKPMLQPESAVQKWIVLLGGSDLGPYTPQAGARPQAWRGDVPIIIPNEATSKRRPVNSDDSSDDDCNDQRSRDKIREASAPACLRAIGIIIPWNIHIGIF
jgi:hypothetical protein